MPDWLKKNPVITGITAGYLILAVHLLLVIVLAAAVIFIQTLAEYIEYVLAGGLLLILGSGYVFYRLLKKNGKQILETMQSPGFAGQNITVSLLGGLASISLKQNDEPGREALSYRPAELAALPEKSSPQPQDELFRLASLHEQGLLSKAEFDLLKDQVITKTIKASEADHRSA